MVLKKSIEFEGKTIEEAIQNSLKALKLKRGQIKIDVLTEEEKGLFGMPGARPAKVRITLRKHKENT